ncbi:DNRLRE domain-containing protein [Cryomorphaceae bacterium 1068]|nr:DNRLRE domain-containing protein [Cryomorphaceae bacterium 1068]
MRQCYTLLFIFLCFELSAQETIIYQPGPEDGKDAFIYTLEPELNVGDHQNFMASAWTNGLTPLAVRCLIDVIPPDLPPDVNILEAKLSLYSYDSSSNGPHSTLSGSNNAVLRKIIEPWEEETVTWANRPAMTTINQVQLPASTAAIQDYLDIDITILVQEMIDNPETGHGLMIKLATEQPYRAMVFGSSDNDNPELWPKIEITYETTLSSDWGESESELTLFPNPTSEIVRVQGKELNGSELRIYDLNGRLIESYKQLSDELLEINVAHLANGSYVVQLVNSTGISSNHTLVIAR